jgi:hypothetical protein
MTSHEAVAFEKAATAMPERERLALFESIYDNYVAAVAKGTEQLYPKEMRDLRNEIADARKRLGLPERA